ncbi:MAG: GTPase [Candidatus Hadarchaeota archaeon]
MPTNVSPEYIKAEQKYQQARTIEEKIAATEELIRAAPKHKGTEKLLSTLKRRLAKLRRELEEKRERRSGRGGGQPFAVKKEGAAQVALVGMPNSGKSTLLRMLTSAKPEVTDHPFATTEPVPGMMQFEDVQIQLVEIPAIVEGSSVGRGLGAKPLSAARNADVVALVIDSSSNAVRQARTLIEELETAGVRLNKRPLAVSIERRPAGGVEIKGGGFVDGGEEEVKKILISHRIHNAFVIVEEPVTADEFEGVLEEASVYRRAFFIVTKSNSRGAAESLSREFRDFPIILSSSEPGKVKAEIYSGMNLIRIYTRRPDEDPAKRPLVIPKGSTVSDVAGAVHRDFKESLKFARVWGSTRFPGQQVKRDYILSDRDIVELHL